MGRVSVAVGIGLKVMARLAMAVAAVAAVAAAGVEAAPNSYVLDTNFGPLTLTIDRATGNARGAYPKYQGTIVGVVGRDGHSIYGTWFQPRADNACEDSNEGTAYWGYVDLAFPLGTRPGAPLRGTWGYCRAQPQEPWEGVFR